MPSKESELLIQVCNGITSAQAANPEMGLDEMRQRFEGLHVCASEPTGVTYEEVEVVGRPALWARPVGAPEDRVILYLHGGGFVMMSPSSHRKMVGHLAKASGTSALLLDYRLAPEHPFPAQIEDAIAAYRWLLDQGIKPNKIATSGDSAGGNLCTTVVLKARDDGLPLPAAIVAFSPWYDMEVNGKTLETNAATDVLVQKPLVENMVTTVLGTQSRTNPLINPLHADPKGLPPMFISCGTAETLQDNATRFAERAKKAGVEVHLEETEGMQHVHVFLAGRAPEADSVLADAGKFLKSKLGAN